MERFLKFVADIMEVDISEVSMDMVYKEKRWDSFMMLTLIMEIEAEYGVTIPMERVGNIRTLADMYTFVK